MAIIRTTCETCGDVEFPSSDARVTVRTVDGAGILEAACPGDLHPLDPQTGKKVGATILNYLNSDVTDLLVAAGTPAQFV